MLKQGVYPCIWAGTLPHLLKLLSPRTKTFKSCDTKTELVLKRKRLLKINEERKDAFRSAKGLDEKIRNNLLEEYSR